MGVCACARSASVSCLHQDKNLTMFSLFLCHSTQFHPPFPSFHFQTICDFNYGPFFFFFNIMPFILFRLEYGSLLLLNFFSSVVLILSERFWVLLCLKMCYFYVALDVMYRSLGSKLLPTALWQYALIVFKHPVLLMRSLMTSQFSFFCGKLFLFLFISFF